MKKIICLLAAFLCLSVQAQILPVNTTSIRIVVPVPPGGSYDKIARSLERPLQDALGNSVYVENRPGGNAVIGTREVANHQGQEPALLISGLGVFINNRAIDGITDITPIYYLGYMPEIMLARPDFQYATVSDVVKHSTERITIASISPGDLGSVLVSSIKKPNLDLIPYKGGQQALADLLSGVIDMAPANLAMAKSLVDSGRVKPLAITGTQRHPSLATVPTYNEQSISLPSSLQFYVWVSKGATSSQIERLTQALDIAVKSDAFRKNTEILGLTRLPIKVSALEHFAESRQRIHNIINK